MLARLWGLVRTLLRNRARIQNILTAVVESLKLAVGVARGSESDAAQVHETIKEKVLRSLIDSVAFGMSIFASVLGFENLPRTVRNLVEEAQKKAHAPLDALLKAVRKAFAGILNRLGLGDDAGAVLVATEKSEKRGIVFAVNSNREVRVVASPSEKWEDFKKRYCCDAEFGDSFKSDVNNLRNSQKTGSNAKYTKEDVTKATGYRTKVKGELERVRDLVDGEACKGLPETSSSEGTTRSASAPAKCEDLACASEEQICTFLRESAGAISNALGGFLGTVVRTVAVGYGNGVCKFSVSCSANETPESCARGIEAATAVARQRGISYTGLIQVTGEPERWHAEAQLLQVMTPQYIAITRPPCEGTGANPPVQSCRSRLDASRAKVC